MARKKNTVETILRNIIFCCIPPQFFIMTKDVKSKTDSFKDNDEKNTMDLNSDFPKAKLTVVERTARSIARYPKTYLVASLVIATALSAIGLIAGDFKIEVDNKGWRSRGTLISDREMQVDVLNLNRNKLYEDTDGTYWEYLKTTLTRGFVDLLEREDAYERKLLFLSDESLEKVESKRRRTKDRRLSGSLKNKWDPLEYTKFHFKMLSDSRRISKNERKISTQNVNSRFLALDDTCDTSWYNNYEQVLNEDNTYAVWKVQPGLDASTLSALDKEVLEQICESEVKTLAVMKEANVCKKCSDGNCLPPHSLVLLLRNKLNNHQSTCKELMDLYTSQVQEEFTSQLYNCTVEYLENFDASTLTPGNSPSCPEGFIPNLVDFFFGKDGNTKLRYTSSFFHTFEADVNKVYQVYREFDGADGKIVRGVYDTVEESFNEIYVDELIVSDMSLAVASLGITFVAMIIHTRSMWLTLMGVLQIIYAIPLAYFVYVFIARLTFFPFLNFIGVFVSAALGADYLFVAVDKFKNARIHNRNGSTEDIAQAALPNAAAAMLLTTSTTTVAFFATCICPVPPILCFAVYCGLMISFNYFMNLAFVFPALCLYDIWLQNGSKNCFIAIASKRLVQEDDIEDLEKEDPEQDMQLKLSFIHRILSGYYSFVHRFKWAVLIASLVAIGVCTYFALNLPLPDTTEVRLLPEGHPLEFHFKWRGLLLSSSLFSTGTSVQIIFGLKPGDTGVQNNPDTLSKLLLDDTFKPREQDSQLYLRDFCDRFFSEDFARKQYPEYECAINQFDSWLSEQSASQTPDTSYANNCGGASALPLPESTFDQCIIAWSQAVNNRDVLGENGTVRILMIDSLASIDLMSSIPEIDAEWNRFEAFLEKESSAAPSGANKFIHASPLWWWFDTNQQMLSTAIGAAGIAIAFSALVVLFSSRSLILTVFAAICILYVLAAATATLVGLGWELGFLESVCFAILVGISCDFVIHFGHAYIHFPGHVDKHERTKYAVLHMGPSILAAAATTFAAAIVMLFCKVVFFTKFAMILLMTILHATIGSFVVYIVLNDIFGPAEPTRFIDQLLVCGKKDDVSNSTDDDVAMTRHAIEDKPDIEVTIGSTVTVPQNGKGQEEVEIVISDKP